LRKSNGGTGKRGILGRKGRMARGTRRGREVFLTKEKGGAEPNPCGGRGKMLCDLWTGKAVREERSAK